MEKNAIADKPCIIAIDEFQQITKYGDETVEATLRTYVQKTTNAHFIFSGSQRHLMNGMFTSPSRPFYQSVTVINLQPLSLEKYTEFAEAKFSEAGYLLDPFVVEILYKRYDGVTSYIHRMLNILFSRMESGQSCTSDMIDSAEDFILRLSSDTYESLFYQMPAKQRSIFLAIASEGSASEVMGSGFIKRHSLTAEYQQRQSKLTSRYFTIHCWDTRFPLTERLSNVLIQLSPDRIHIMRVYFSSVQKTILDIW